MKNFKKVIETFEKNKEREIVICQRCAANVFMKEVGTDCIDFMLDSNNTFGKILKEFGFRKSGSCKKNATIAYIVATKLLEKNKNKI